MIKALMVAASLGFSLSAAGACEFMRSADAEVDQTVVASVVLDEPTMSTPEEAIILDEATRQKAAEDLMQ